MNVNELSNNIFVLRGLLINAAVEDAIGKLRAALALADRNDHLAKDRLIRALKIMEATNA